MNSLSSHGYGQVLWITGLSGAGKTSLAREVAIRLRTVSSSIVMLDGDELREVFGTAEINLQNHAREVRLTLAMQYARLCKILTEQGLTVVIATISLFHEVHKWNRNNLPNYFEVYLRIPIDELRKRDTKRIYERFDSGQLTNVAGLDLPIEEPLAADWTVDFDQNNSPEILADKLIEIIRTRG